MKVILALFLVIVAIAIGCNSNGLVPSAIHTALIAVALYLLWPTLTKGE